MTIYLKVLRRFLSSFKYKLLIEQIKHHKGLDKANQPKSDKGQDGEVTKKCNSLSK